MRRQCWGDRLQRGSTCFLAPVPAYLSYLPATCRAFLAATPIQDVLTAALQLASSSFAFDTPGPWKARSLSSPQSKFSASQFEILGKWRHMTMDTTDHAMQDTCAGSTSSLQHGYFLPQCFKKTKGSRLPGKNTGSRSLLQYLELWSPTLRSPNERICMSPSLGFFCLQYALLSFILSPLTTPNLTDYDDQKGVARPALYPRYPSPSIIPVELVQTTPGPHLLCGIKHKAE